VGCGEDPPPPEPVVRPIKMLTIGGGLAGTREYPGRLRAGQQVDMAFEVPGRIVEFAYKEGTLVEAGAILARLDPRDYENTLEQSKATLRNRRTYLARIAKAHETRAVPEQDLNDAQAQLEVAQAEVRIQQKRLDETRLIAPFEGIMARKLVEDFANVQEKQPVLIFEDSSLLEIKVAIPERDMAGRPPTSRDWDEVSRRLQPRVTVTSLPKLEFPAVLKELATTADPTTRTFEATFRFENPADVVVLPGMTAKVRVDVDAASGAAEISIPAHAAVADEEGRSTVWVVDPETMAVSRRPVSLGELGGDQVQIADGLRDGDVVAISGVSQLRPGMVVRRWER
jgi:RND family efflux transporter MFP subunit